MREACARGAPWVSKSTHPRKFGNNVTVHRLNKQPSVCTTRKPMFTLTLSCLFGSPGENLIARQCCDQLTAVKAGYPLTSTTWPYRALRCRPIEVGYFFEVYTDKLLVFKWSQAQVYIFLNSYEICCVYVTMAPLESSASYLKIQTGKTFSYHGHGFVKLYVQLFLCSDWSKFDRWVHAENLYSILKLVYFDSWSWQSFVSTCDVFNRLFPLDVQNEIQLLSRVFCYSWLVCLLGFWLRNASLVKIR